MNNSSDLDRTKLRLDSLVKIAAQCMISHAHRTAGQLSLLRMLKILDPCQKLNSKASFSFTCQVIQLQQATGARTTIQLEGEPTHVQCLTCIGVTGLLQMIFLGICSFWKQYCICFNFERLAQLPGLLLLNICLP